VVSFVFIGCPADGNGETVWLADLSNPFLGKWQSEIPSTDYAVVKFDFKQDGTFTCEFPAGPDNTMTATGGYLVNGNVQVSFMSFDDGIGGYTFTVVDNDTIAVTEIEEVKEDGAIVPGNTAHFTRVPDSAVNKENKPFALSNILIGGTWKETATTQKVEYQFRADGTGTMKYQAGEQTVSPEIVYFTFHDQGIQKDVLVTFIPGMNAFTPYSFATENNNQNTITVSEITGVTMGEQGPSATYGEALTFTRSN
jgi:hypothetical protein